jgi:hypothetical protein
MKKNLHRLLTIVFVVLQLFICSFTFLSEVKFSKEEISQALKSALAIGVENTVKSVGKNDGFLKNDLIKIPFPQDAIQVKNTAEKFKMKPQVDQFITTLNRAAEEASKNALPIFMNTLKTMSIDDALSILQGGDGSATKYLQTKSTNELEKNFYPIVTKAIEKVNLTKYWSPLATKYNKTILFTGGQKVNPDLNDYVTKKAISGMFVLIEKEENKIRKDPKLAITGISDASNQLITSIFESVLKK